MRSDLVEEVIITSYGHLIKRINSDPVNFRQNFIFRGLGNKKYELLPKALRKDEDDYIIKKYIDSNLLFKVPIDTFFKELNISDYGKLSAKKEVVIDKFGNPKSDCDDESFEVDNIKKAIFKQELCILSKFLDLAGKSGLNLSADREVYEFLHTCLDDFPDDLSWPDSRFFELISLAQHYGLPTEALDWSYDYKVALYFAVRNILKDDTSDCVLWAFNYKHFRQYSLCENQPRLQFHMSDYYTNPNFKAQKQLSTFIVNEGYDFDERSFEKIVIDDVMNGISSINNAESEISFKLDGLKKFTLKNGEKIFYKFIIPGELKHEILRSIYIEGYSEEFLFPGYSGVVMAMNNGIRLDDHFNNIKTDKKDVLMVFDEEDDIKYIKNFEKKVIFSNYDFKHDIDKIFIYSKESKEVVGFFNGDKIIRNTLEKLYEALSNDCKISQKKFLNYFKDNKEGFVIKISHLKIFDYPIPISNFNPSNPVHYIQNNNDLKFLLNFKFL